MKPVLVIAMLIFLSGCVTTPEQQSYLDGSDAYLAKDYDLAKEKIQYCASKNHYQCNYILGMVTLKKDGPYQSIPYFKKEAVVGNKEAQALLSIAIYRTYMEFKSSNKPTPQDIDLSEAIGWIWVAKKQGYTGANDLLSDLTFQHASDLNTDPNLLIASLMPKLEQYEKNYIKNP